MPAMLPLVYHEGGNGGSVLRQEPFKVTHNTEDPIEHLSENDFHGFSLSNPLFIERYLKLKLYILIEFYIRRINKDFLAFVTKNPWLTDACPSTEYRAADFPGGAEMLTNVQITDRQSSGEKKSYAYP